MEKQNRDNTLILKEEFYLKWRDLYKIRLSLAGKLQKRNFSKQQADPIIIIISELLENAFKFIDKKIVTLVLKYTSEKKDELLIKIHHPISTFQSNNIRILLSTISKVNICTDIEKLFIDSLREAILINAKANKFRFSLIRKTAKGKTIQIKKSLIYIPGIIISIAYNLK